MIDFKQIFVNIFTALASLTFVVLFIVLGLNNYIYILLLILLYIDYNLNYDPFTFRLK